ncbi:hypothetical protein BG011_001897 [Mortierella polycephala]|uniref:rRNA biogenesis protein RRP36 n=1 Tax=Mortierella polycephala TaxID=41804 RepID=A0A9P6TV35_9FUNG|nr:hypothetical protein BG011_001897 [Mortierella polycephala]
MAIKSRGKPQVEEDAESRALRRMQAFDQSDSDLDQGNSDNSEQDESEEDESEDQDESEDEEQSEDDDDEGQSEEVDEEEDEESSDSDDSDEDSDASDDDSDDSDSDADDKKLKELQKNLSQIPFDKLAEIQQKVGMKVFHQTIRGSEKKKAATKGVQRSSRVAQDDDDSEEEDESDEDDRKPKNKMDKLRNAMNKDKKERRVIEKRADKNRPMEMGSKKPVGRFRQVVEVPTAKRRDPRFDSLSGKLDTDLFEKSYSFLKDYQTDEMQKLKELIKKERDSDMKEKLQTQLSRMVDRQATEATLKRRQEIKREHKRKEKELVAKGKNPFFLKKADQKKLELINKFQHLKENPKALARAMEKRRKRNAAKEKTKVLGTKRRRVD